MAVGSAKSPWSSWSLSTKVTVGVGFLVAAALVVFLYYPT